MISSPDVATVPVLKKRSTAQVWWQLAIVSALVGWLYAPILARLAKQWWTDPNFSHGFLVPVFSLYILCEKRAYLRALPHKPSWAGIGIVVFALFTLLLGVMSAELFLARASFVILLGGLVVAFLGWQHLRVALFPWLFLLLMIPIPAIIFNQITFPLQFLTSKLASHALPLLGVPTLREGNVIRLPAMPLEVADACSGIRSLLSLGTLTVIYSYLFERRTAIRLTLTLAAVPIAVLANALRIVGTGLLVQYWDPTKAEGFFHGFTGWIAFLLSLGMIFLLHQMTCAIQRWQQRRRA